MNEMHGLTIEDVEKALNIEKLLNKHHDEPCVDNTSILLALGEEIQQYYEQHEEIEQKLRKIRKKEENMENQRELLEATMEKGLPTTLSLITGIPLEEIKVNVYECKMWINHEDKIKLLDMFKVLLNQLTDDYDIRCYVQKRSIEIRYNQQEEEDLWQQ